MKLKSRLTLAAALALSLCGTSQAATELVRLANEKGGKDNISVVLVRPQNPSNGQAGIMTKFNSFLKKGS